MYMRIYVQMCMCARVYTMHMYKNVINLYTRSFGITHPPT